MLDQDGHEGIQRGSGILSEGQYIHKSQASATAKAYKEARKRLSILNGQRWIGHACLGCRHADATSAFDRRCAQEGAMMKRSAVTSLLHI